MQSRDPDIVQYETIIETNPFKNLKTWGEVFQKLQSLRISETNLFHYLSEEVRLAIKDGETDRFRKLRQVATDYLKYIPKNLLKALDAEDFQGSLLFEAVKHRRHEIAKELLCPSHEYDPYHKNESGQTVFDIVVGFNDTKMLGVLLMYWSASSADLQKLSTVPSDDSELVKMYDLLNEPYRKFQGNLTDAMRWALQKELLYLDSHRAIFSLIKAMQTTASKDDPIKVMAQRANMLICALDILFSHQRGYQSLSSSGERTDVIIFGFLAQNIRFLKRHLKGSYADFPWEVLEFLSSQLLSVNTRCSRIEELEARIPMVVGRLKELRGPGVGIMLYSEEKFKKFDEECDALTQANESDKEELKSLKKAQEKPLALVRKAPGFLFDDLKKLREKLRETITPDYLKRANEAKSETNEGERVSSYDALYDVGDFTRDTYSLERIIHYLSEVSNVDCAKFLGRAVIHRAIQVVGEYIKHTAISPHLTTTVKLPILLQGLNPKSLEDTRNLLSHLRSFIDLNELDIKPDREELYKRMQEDIKALREHFVTALKKHDLIMPASLDKESLAKYYHDCEYASTQATHSGSDSFSSFQEFHDLLDTWVLPEEQRYSLLSTLPSRLFGPTAIMLKDAQKQLVNFFQSDRPRESSHEHFLDANTFNKLLERLEVSAKDRRFIQEQFSGVFCDKPNVVSYIQESKDNFSVLMKLLGGDNAGVTDANLKGILEGYGLSVKGEACKKWKDLFSRLKKKDNDRRLSLEKMLLKFDQLRSFLNREVPAFNDLLDCEREKKAEDHPDFIKANLSFMSIFEKNVPLRNALEFMVLELLEGLVGERGVVSDYFRGFFNFTKHDRNYFAHGDPLRESLRFDSITHIANLLLSLFSYDYHVVCANYILRKLDSEPGKEIKACIEALFSTSQDVHKQVTVEFDKLLPMTDSKTAKKAIKGFSRPEDIQLFREMLSRYKKVSLFGELSQYIFPEEAPKEKSWESYDLEFSWQTLQNQTCVGNFQYLLQQSDIANIARDVFHYQSNGDLADFEIVGSGAQLRNVLREHAARYANHQDQALTMVINLGNAHWVTMVMRHNALSPNNPTILYRDSFGADVPGYVRETIREQYPEANITCVPGVQQTNSYDCGVIALMNADILTRNTDAVVAGGYSGFFSTILAENELRERRSNWLNQLEMPQNNPVLGVGMFSVSSENSSASHSLSRAP